MLDLSKRDRLLYEPSGYQEVGIDKSELSGINIVDGKEYPWRENCIFLIKNLSTRKELEQNNFQYGRVYKC